VPDCPSCGGALSSVEGDAQTAPWGCYPCGLGFWNAELTDEARANYRPEFMDYGLGAPGKAIREAAEAEARQAAES
jgi:hypothetical protein